MLGAQTRAAAARGLRALAPGDATEHSRCATALAAVVLAVVLLLGPTAPELAAQTIRGRLLDAETGQPIDLGLVMMFTETGDSITATLSDRSGTFSLTSAEPGDFVLLASAYGYRETPAGVFELGPGGEMTVDYRIAPEPLMIDELLVGVDRPVFEHNLIRQGFVRRMQRGLGHFITPYDIEQSTARETETLMEDVPGVFVGPPRDTGGSPLTHMGNTIQMRSSSGFLCTPQVYVDGIRVPAAADHMTMFAPLQSVEAIEVYRRPAEIPVEYAVTQQSGSWPSGTCGVLVLWTKTGPRPEQRAATEADYDAAEAVARGENPYRLPDVGADGPPPSPGERIRLQLAGDATRTSGLEPLWEGTYLALRESELVGNDISTGRPVAVPLAGIEALQVQRARGRGHAVQRGAIAGSVFGVGMWLSLRAICGSACTRRDDAILPSALVGGIVGLMVWSRGPGNHWVAAPVPEPAPPGG